MIVIPSVNVEPLPAALFGEYRAVIFAAVLRSPTGFANNLARCCSDLHYFAALTSSKRLRGLVCALSVHVVLSAVAAVAPNDTLIHVFLPFSRLTGRADLMVWAVGACDRLPGCITAGFPASLCSAGFKPPAGFPAVPGTIVSHTITLSLLRGCRLFHRRTV